MHTTISNNPSHLNPSTYSSYVPGFTGHLPKVQREEVVYKIVNNKLAKLASYI